MNIYVLNNQDIWLKYVRDNTNNIYTYINKNEIEEEENDKKKC